MLDFEWIYFFTLYLFFLGIHLKFKGIKSIFLNSIFFIYSLGVISVTILPIPIEGIDDFIETGFEPNNNFFPFSSIIQIVTEMPLHVILRQIGGNLTLLLPLGFLLPLIWEKQQRFWKALQVGFSFSLGIELTQLLISTILGFTYKIFDVDDLILNTVGFAVGYLFFKLYQIGMKTPLPTSPKERGKI